MRWFERDIWKAGLTFAGILLLLVLMVGVPVSVVGAYEGGPGLARPATVKVLATPTEDATVAALNKEKLAQEVQQLRDQNTPDLFGWLRTNASILLSTLVVVIGGLIGLFRWLADRRNEQEKRREDRRDEQEKRREDLHTELEKRAEERFQAAVAGLGDEKEGAKIGAAILLRTFLRPGYEQYYTQTFDLAVANLRLPRTPNPPVNPYLPQTFSQQPPVNPYLPQTFGQQPTGDLPQTFDQQPRQTINLQPTQPFDPNSIPGQNAWAGWSTMNTNYQSGPLPLTTLSQALIVVFKEAFPLARSQDERGSQFLDATGPLTGPLVRSQNERGTQFLDATGIQLDNAYIRGADLKGIWMPQASLQMSDLSYAQLSHGQLSGTNLSRANLSRANLSRANLSFAYLSRADLSRADLSFANLSSANLSNARLSGTNLNMTDLSYANLSYADLGGTNLSTANLSKANLSGVNGLTEEQLATCKTKGAIIDEAGVTIVEQPTTILTEELLAAYKTKGAVVAEDSMTSPPQLPVSPAASSRGNDVQAPPVPSVQGNIPTSDTGGNSGTSSKPAQES